ncbi:hypothetical protein BA6E_101340 [Bacteroidales bacterium 6E]|nr:hypothetical protein BA6E_101340 [Bacteroidales bacterium 6E]
MVGFCVSNGMGTISVCDFETGGLCLFAFKMGITNVSVKDEGEFLLKMGGLTCSCFICIGLNPGDVLIKVGGSRDGGSLKPALVSRTADPSPLYTRGYYNHVTPTGL